MKKKITIVILILFCYSELRPLLPYLDYYMNYEYISKVLCINKEKPKLACNGKCYLGQQLKEAEKSEKQEKNLPPFSLERMPIVLCYYEFTKCILFKTSSQKHDDTYHFSIKDYTISPLTPPPKYLLNLS